MNNGQFIFVALCFAYVVFWEITIKLGIYNLHKKLEYIEDMIRRSKGEEK